MMDRAGGQEFTLGQVVGEIRALAGQMERMESRLDRRIDEVKGDLKDLVGGARDGLQKQVDECRGRVGKLERSNGAWRWIERVGTFLGALLSGWFGGKMGGGSS